MNIKQILTVFAVMAVAAVGIYSVAAFAAPTSHSEGDAVILEVDGETLSEWEVETDSEYSVNVYDADSTELGTYTATTEADDDMFIVEATIVDNDLIDREDDNEVSEGDELTIELYDDTDAVAVEEISVTVAHIADATFDVDEEIVMNEDIVSIDTDEPMFGLFGDENDIAEVEHEFVLDESEEEQKVVLNKEDTEVTDIYAESVDGLGAGDVADQKLSVNGEDLHVHTDDVPEDDADGVTAVYDTDLDATIVAGEFDRQSVYIESVGNDDYGIFDGPGGFWESLTSPELPDFLDSSDDEEDTEDSTEDDTEE